MERKKEKGQTKQDYTILMLIETYKETKALDSVGFKLNRIASGGKSLEINNHLWYIILKDGSIKEMIVKHDI